MLSIEKNQLAEQSEPSNGSQLKTTEVDSSSISVKRLFANLMLNSSFQSLKIPFSDDEHYLLSADSIYYVNDKEIMSIVAFTLSTKEYKEFLYNCKIAKSNPSTQTDNNTPASSMKEPHIQEFGSLFEFFLNILNKFYFY